MRQNEIQGKEAAWARRVAIALLLTMSAMAAMPAAAAVFTVTLTNGTEFDTRYRPMESPSDATKIQLLTEHGNWISIPRSLVAGIESDFEARGYGTVLDTNTVVLGYSINDLPAEEGGGAASPADALLEYLRGPQQEPFSVNQFAEPPEVGGNATGGVPIGFTSSTTPPLGRSGSAEPQIAGDNQ